MPINLHENYIPISLMITHTEILNKIPVNQIQQHMKGMIPHVQVKTDLQNARMFQNIQINQCNTAH